MPQIYGRRKAKMDVSQIFTDATEDYTMLENHGSQTGQAQFSRKDRRYGNPPSDVTSNVPQENHAQCSKGFAFVDASSSPIHYKRLNGQSPNQETSRSALDHIDFNVRRSPRLASKATKHSAVHEPESPSRGTEPLLTKAKASGSFPRGELTSDAPSQVSTEQTQTLSRSKQRRMLSSSDAQSQHTYQPPVKDSDHSTTRPTPSNTDLIAYTQPLLQFCSHAKGSNGPTDFQEWADKLDEYFTVGKIAEASYGEVYRLSLRDVSSDLSKAEESVLKVIALKPSTEMAKRLSKAQVKRVNAMSDVADVAGEVRLLQRMTPVPGFANFRECHVAKGPLPRQFVSAWRTFNKDVKKSDFPDPGRKSSYHEEQLWAILEMQDAGQDLEEKPMQSVWHVWDIFWGTAIALAKGEEWAKFEHRDLHLGNICVQWQGESNDEEGLKKRESTCNLGSTGARVTLIDYTLSRADVVDDSAVDCAFLDLSKDTEIFEGDGNIDYQYDIYRFMHSAILHHDPNVPYALTRKPRRGHARTESESTPWRRYAPLTNLLWLHFVLYKLMEQLIEWPSSVPARRRKQLSKVRHKAATDVEQKLQHLWELLDLEHMREWWCDEGMASATGLVEWAVAEGWLSQEDVLNLPLVGTNRLSEDDCLLGEMDKLNLAEESPVHHDVEEPKLRL